MLGVVSPLLCLNEGIQQMSADVSSSEIFMGLDELVKSAKDSFLH